MDSGKEKLDEKEGVDHNKLKEEKERLRRFAQNYAQKKGLALNPDEEIVDMVLTGLAKKHLQHGKPFCPCYSLTGDPEEDRKIVCPCDFHLDSIDKIGRCHCGIYVKKDYK